MNLKRMMDESMSGIQVGEELKDEILNQTVRKSRMAGFSKGYRKSVVAAGLCAVALIGSVSVAATELPKLWDKTVAEMTKTGKAAQEKGIHDGVVDVVSDHEKSDYEKKERQEVTEATHDGVTVRVKQTMTDSNGMYIYLEVEAPKGVKLDADTMCFDKSVCTLDGRNAYGNIGSGFVRDEFAVSPNKRGYEFFLLNDWEVEASGKEISLRLTNLISEDMRDPAGKEEVVARGTWDLKWTVSTASKQKKVILLGQTIALKKGTLTLRQMELSPMSFRILYDMDKNVSLKNGLPYTVSLKMKDGMVYEYTDEGYSLFDGPATVTSEYELQGFWGVIDVEQVAAVCINGTDYPVK